MGHLGEELHVLAAEQAGDLVFGNLVHRVGAEALHFTGVDAGVGERGEGRLHRQAQFGASGILGELGGAEADDGGLAGKL
ncbi:hypothetical protein D9M71_222440 [compost metagenome]